MEGESKWEAEPNRAIYRSLLQKGKYADIAIPAVRIESRTNLLFPSFL